MSAIWQPLAGFLAQWASTFWSILRETGPFLVFGLLMAGVLHVLVPPRIILWALGHRGWRGAIRGSLIGLPLPLCSCGVVPTALTLRRQGASLAAATSFTISTPETSVDALAITAALLPAAFLGVRPLAALLLAVIVGTIVELFSTTSRKEELRVNVMKLSRLMEEQKAGHCDDASCGETHGGLGEICRVCGLLVDSETEHAHRLPARLGAIFSYAFGTFFRDIATWVMFGLIVAALLELLIPSGGLSVSFLGRHPNFQVLLAILAGIPMYSCATATTPLAAVLLSKGLNPGAALALLLAGPATNIGSVFAFKRELGGRITAVYYGSLLVLCWFFGVVFNFLWPAIERVPGLARVAGGPGLEWAHGLPGWLELGAAWVLVLLTARIWLRDAYRRVVHGKSHDHDHDHDHGHAHAH